MSEGRTLALLLLAITISSLALLLLILNLGIDLGYWMSNSIHGSQSCFHQ